MFSRRPLNTHTHTLINAFDVEVFVLRMDKDDGVILRNGESDIRQ